ncbi:MAG: PAS domain S-box protein [Alsobacter sp.]
MVDADKMVKRQQVLADFGEFALRSDDLDAVLTQAYRLVADALGTGRAKVLEIEHEGAALFVRAGVGWGPGVVGSLRLPMSELSSETYSIELGQPVITRDLRAEERFDLPAFLKDAGVRALANVPIFLPGGRAFGLLQVDASEPRAFGEEDVQFLRTYATILGPVIDRLIKVKALQASEARLARVLDEVPIGVGLFDRDGRLSFKNPALQAVTDDFIPSRMASPKAVWEAFDPEGRRVLPANYPGAMALRGEDASSPVDFRRVAGGQTRWLRVSAVPVRQNGEITGGITVVQDVTEERRVHGALRELAQRNTEILESISDAFYAIDRDSRFTYVNRKAEEWWKRPREGLLGQVFTEVFPQSVDSEPYRAQTRAMETREVVRLEAVSPVLGHWIDISLYPTADGGLSVYFRDISDRKQADERLRESERRFRTLAEGIPQLVWRASQVGLWSWTSPQWTAFTGQPAAASQGWGWLDCVHPDDRETARRAWERAREAGEFHAGYRIRCGSDGSYRFFQTQASQVRDEGGRVVEWLGTSTDVDDIRRLQEEQEVLVAELQHRTRNLIGVVQSLADRTSADSKSLVDFQSRFRDRLDALARVQGLLSRKEKGQRVTFDELIRTELAGLGAVDRSGKGPQVALEGPAGVRLRSATVQTLALGLHELATNALKYGALSKPEGRLSVTWAVRREGRGEGRLDVTWQERGVRLAPSRTGNLARRGYGRELIERALPYQLKAETAYELTPDGVRCTISLPLSDKGPGRPKL